MVHVFFFGGGGGGGGRVLTGYSKWGRPALCPEAVGRLVVPAPLAIPVLAAESLEAIRV